MGNIEKNINTLNFKTKIGTCDKNNPQVIYLDTKTFISPVNELNSYVVDVNRIKRQFNRFIDGRLHENSVFKNNYILVFDVASKQIQFGKKSILNIEILFKQKNVINVKKLSAVKKEQYDFFADIINKLHEIIDDNNFTTYRSKK